MSENILQLVQALKLLTVVGFATAYGYGGITGKWRRRILGAFLITASIVGLSVWMDTFSWWLLLCAPLYFGGLSKGYGSSEFKTKLLKRSIAGFLFGLAALPVGIVLENYLLLGFNIFMCVITSVVLGVFNPFSRGKSKGGARAEETCIGFIYGFYPIMMI